MKKIILLCIIIACACQLKAQQLFKVKPSDSLSNNPLEKYCKLKPNNTYQFALPLQNFNMVSANSIVKNISPEDHMPIMVLGGDSKMPVAKLGGYYTMPVKKIGSEDTDVVVSKLLPGLPTFKTP